MKSSSGKLQQLFFPLSNYMKTEMEKKVKSFSFGQLKNLGIDKIVSYKMGKK